MFSIINLSTSATTTEDRARAIEQFHATALSLMTRGKNVHVSVSARDYDDSELIEDEPDWEQKYNDLLWKISNLAQEWQDGPQQYKLKMAEQLLEVTGLTGTD